jgi:hypothetical protein
VEKGYSVLSNAVLGLFAVVCFITFQLFISHTAKAHVESKKKLECSINFSDHAEFPSDDGQSKITTSPSQLLLNAPLNISQEVFLIFEIYYTRESIYERVITAPVPLNKFLYVVLREIISPNAP